MVTCEIRINTPMSDYRKAVLRDHVADLLGGEVRVFANASITPRADLGWIVRAVAFTMGIPREAVLGPRRDPSAMRARKAIAWVARRVTDRSLVQIAVAIGRTDHKTVLNLLRGAEQLRDADPAFELLTDRVTAAYWRRAGR